MDVQRLALLAAALEPADERLGDVRVGLDREQQRDVDVDALVDHLLDRGHPGVGARNLDEHVGTVEALPEHARLLDRDLGVVRGVGLDLERHVSVDPVRLLPHRAQDIGGHLHVAHGHLAVHLLHAVAGASQLLELVVVVLGAEDGLLEDRRIRRDSAQAVLLDQALELASLDQAPADLVQPDAGAGGGQGRQPLVDLGRNAHRLAPLTRYRSLALPTARRCMSSLPSSTACRAVMPKCS